MSGKIIWAIEDMVNDKIYGVFSTKGKAIDAIDMWGNTTNSYKVETNINMIPRLNGEPAAITIRYYGNGETVTFWLKRFNLNNGAGLLHVHRNHFGKTDENEKAK